MGNYGIDVKDPGKILMMQITKSKNPEITKSPKLQLPYYPNTTIPYYHITLLPTPNYLLLRISIISPFNSFVYTCVRERISPWGTTR